MNIFKPTFKTNEQQSPSEKKVYRPNQYLGEVIEQILNESKGKSLLIESPMKSGKTTSIKMIKEYYEKSTNGKVVCVITSPKKLLQNMIFNDLEKLGCLVTKVNGDHGNSNYRYNSMVDYIVTTCDSSYKIFRELSDHKVKYICVNDEVHAHYIHSEFRKGLIVPRKHINDDMMIKYIGLSATTEFIPTDEFETSAFVRPKQQWKFTEELGVKKIDTENRSAEIVNRIKKSIEEGIYQYIVRVNDIKYLNKLEKEINNLGFDTLVFSSDNFKDNEELLTYITDRKDLDKSIILSTSVSDEGIELLTVDNNVSVICLHNANSNIYDEIQFMGRFRNGTKKCTLLVEKEVKGSPYKEAYELAYNCALDNLKLSNLLGVNKFKNLIEEDKDGKFAIKDNVIKEWAIKADIAEKYGTVEKIKSFLFSYYLTKSIKQEAVFSIRDITGKVRENYCEEAIIANENIKNAIKEEKEQAKENKKKLVEYMTGEFHNLPKHHKEVFLMRSSEIWGNDEWIKSELPQELHELYWATENKENRSLLYKMNEELGKQKDEYNEEIIKQIYDKYGVYTVRAYIDNTVVRRMDKKILDEYMAKIKTMKFFSYEFKMSMIIRTVLLDKEGKQGRITKNDIEKIKSLAIKCKLLSKTKVTRQESTVNNQIKAIYKGIYKFKSDDRISSILK